MYQICNPCGIEYDFVGYYETFNADADYLLDRAKLGMRFPDAMRSPTHSSAEDILTKYYSELSKYRIEELSLSTGLRRDLMLFDYDIPEVIKKNFSL